VEFPLDDIYPTTLKYQPQRDHHFNVAEECSNYVQRIHNSLLPNWPHELLKEWLYRHADSMEKYAFLHFESFRFELKTWERDRIPGGQAFDNEKFVAEFSNVASRAQVGDWLAIHMMREGTWNTPIVLLDNRSNTCRFPDQRLLKSPYHLLEGHRRLSYLIGLKRMGRAALKHTAWIVSV